MRRPSKNSQAYRLELWRGMLGVVAAQQALRRGRTRPVVRPRRRRWRLHRHCCSPTLRARSSATPRCAGEFLGAGRRRAPRCRGRPTTWPWAWGAGRRGSTARPTRWTAAGVVGESGRAGQADGLRAAASITGAEVDAQRQSRRQGCCRPGPTPPGRSPGRRPPGGGRRPVRRYRPLRRLRMSGFLCRGHPACRGLARTHVPSVSDPGSRVRAHPPVPRVRTVISLIVSAPSRGPRVRRRDISRHDPGCPRCRYDDRRREGLPPARALAGLPGHGGCPDRPQRDGRSTRLGRRGQGGRTAQEGARAEGSQADEGTGAAGADGPTTPRMLDHERPPQPAPPPPPSAHRPVERSGEGHAQAVLTQPAPRPVERVAGITVDESTTRDAKGRERTEVERCAAAP